MRLVLKGIFEVGVALVPALQICIDFSQRAPRLASDSVVRTRAGPGHGNASIAGDRWENNGLQAPKRLGRE